ncbi:hypothetical protein DPMN_174287 [Dreissena polymorpha]|uniref:Uncharacterized protein n=1 Tax=Dreissena polymorpha TaxID=45954 RepID=A0A9D4IG98_DREPO|nr:hypothetical protein DPMN_174287 [Dreissena polymorpha]
MRRKADTVDLITGLVSEDALQCTGENSTKSTGDSLTRGRRCDNDTTTSHASDRTQHMTRSTTKKHSEMCHISALCIVCCCIFAYTVVYLCI